MRKRLRAIGAAIGLGLTCVGMALGPAGAQADWSAFDVGSEADRLGQAGTMAVDLTAGASRFIVDNGAWVLNCDTTFATGSIATGLYSVTGTDVVGNLVLQFDDCLGPADLEFDYNCTNPPTGTTDVAVTNLPTPFVGASAVEVVNIYCEIYFPLLDCEAVFEGSMQGSYVNPATPSTPATLTILTAGQDLELTSSECPSFIPTGDMEFGTPVGSGADVADITYTVTGDIEDQPYITPTD